MIQQLAEDEVEDDLYEDDEIAITQTKKKGTNPFGIDIGLAKLVAEKQKEMNLIQIAKDREWAEYLEVK